MEVHTVALERISFYAVISLPVAESLSTVVLEQCLHNMTRFQENRMALSGLWHLGRLIKGVVVKKGAAVYHGTAAPLNHRRSC